MKQEATKGEVINSSELKMINQGIIRGWTTIGGILLLAYMLELVKQTRSVGYIVLFMAILVVPLICRFGLI